MYTTMQKLFFGILLAAPAIASADSLPNSILKQIPHGYSVISFKSGKLNDDKLVDFLVALRNDDESSIRQKTGNAPNRPLLIFTQNADGRFILSKRNDHVIFKMDEGGQCDPFEDGEEGLAIKNHYFTVQNSVACGQHWNDYITFRYVPELRDWVFHKRVSENWVLNSSDDPQAEALVLSNRNVTTGKGKPRVLFAVYHAN